MCPSRADRKLFSNRWISDSTIRGTLSAARAISVDQSSWRSDGPLMLGDCLSIVPSIRILREASRYRVAQQGEDHRGPYDPVFGVRAYEKAQWARQARSA